MTELQFAKRDILRFETWLQWATLRTRRQCSHFCNFKSKFSATRLKYSSRPMKNVCGAFWKSLRHASHPWSRSCFAFGARFGYYLVLLSLWNKCPDLLFGAHFRGWIRMQFTLNVAILVVFFVVLFGAPSDFILELMAVHTRINPRVRKITLVEQRAWNRIIQNLNNILFRNGLNGSLLDEIPRPYCYFSFVELKYRA